MVRNNPGFNTEISKPILLLVEGIDEVHFLEAFFDHLKRHSIKNGICWIKFRFIMLRENQR